MTNKMSALKVANPYAQALFQLTLNSAKKDKSQSPLIFFKAVYDVQSVVRMMQEVPELEEFLKNPLHSQAAKKEVLTKCFTSKITTSTVDFLHFLVEKKRIGFVVMIGESFLDKVYNFLCIKFVEVWSSVELSYEQKQRLSQKLLGFMGKSYQKPYVQYPTVFLTTRIEKNILGGLVIRFDSQLIDLSLRRELNQLEVLS